MEGNQSTSLDKSKDFQTGVSSIDLESSINTPEIIYFYHDIINVRVYNASTAKIIELTDFLIHNEYGEIPTLDENEISQIKSDQILKLFKPKIESYFSKDLPYKCTFMQNLSSYAETIGFEPAVGYLIPLVKAISFEKNEVIIAFLSSIESLITYLLNNNGYDVIISSLTPILEELLSEKKDERVLTYGSSALISIIKVAKEADIGSILLPMVISLAHSDNKVKLQFLSIEIFSSSAKVIGCDLAEAYVVPQFIYFSEDSNDEARLKTISNLIGISEVISKECLEDKIYEMYKRLSNDTFTPVKKKACEILPELAGVAVKSKAEKIYNKLCESFLSFLSDPESGVSQNAAGLFGEFANQICGVISKENKELIFSKYVTKLNRMIKGKGYEIDTTPINRAAFTFPGVVNIYGKEKWESDLKDLFTKFVADKDYRIKKTISNSYAEIAKIIGKELSERDICPIIINYYESNGYEIKNYIVSKLPDFLSVIENKELREKFIDCFIKVAKERKKWRNKIIFAKVLGKLKNIYDDNIIFDKIIPLIVVYCFDDVNEVRKKACRYIGNLFMQIIANEPSQDQNEEENIPTINLRNKALKVIKAFGTCRHYHYRQLFFEFCSKFIKNEEMFMNHLFPMMNDLVYDKVDNVRITLSLFLKKYSAKNEWMKKNEKIQKIIKILKQDKCSPCKENLKAIEIDPSIIIDKNTEIKINDKFTNELEIIKHYFEISPVGLGNTKWINKGNNVDKK